MLFRSALSSLSDRGVPRRLPAVESAHTEPSSSLLILVHPSTARQKGREGWSYGEGEAKCDEMVVLEKQKIRKTGPVARVHLRSLLHTHRACGEACIKAGREPVRMGRTGPDAAWNIDGAEWSY